MNPAVRNRHLFGTKTEVILLCLAGLAGSDALIPFPACGAPSVAITEFLSQPFDEKQNGEWVELFNFGETTVNLQGWTLADEDSDLVILPGSEITPGGFLILARDKTHFEANWAAGIPDERIVQLSRETTAPFRLGKGADEIILRNQRGDLVWSVAYLDDETSGRATFLAEEFPENRAHGTKANPGVSRAEADTSGRLGYQENGATTDALAFVSSAGEVGSPLTGHYAGAAANGLRLTIDLAAPGVPISRGVRGMALWDIPIERPTFRLSIPDALEVTTGSSIRGVAGGLYADLYDWRTRNNEARPATLEFLRWARDAQAELFVTANARGLVERDPADTKKTRYYDCTTETLSSLAGDWVRYTNRIVPRYRQGDPILDARDASILSMLRWNSAHPGDRWDKLLRAGEAPVPKVTYWEIGNEPTVSTGGNIGVSNGYRSSAQDYYERYKAIVRAMKMEDSSIKVGPCVVGGQAKREEEHLKLILSDLTLPVDFIAYHPYQRIGKEETTEGISRALGTVYATQLEWWRTIRGLVEASGRAPSSVEMVASEVNVSDWRYNDTAKEGQMAHALGSVETVFTHARLGLTASHYWIWPSHAWVGTRYPVFEAFAMLRDCLGDTLLGTHSRRNELRVYTTRDSRNGQVAVWVLNFNGSEDHKIRLQLRNATNRVPEFYKLGSRSGKTTHFSANLPHGLPGGPVMDVGWMRKPLPVRADEELVVNFEAATLSVLLFPQAGGEPSRR